MLLLLFHLPKDGIFFNFDKIPTFLFAESKPELFYTFTFLGSTRAPYLIRLL